MELERWIIDVVGFGALLAVLCSCMCVIRRTLRIKGLAPWSLFTLVLVVLLGWLSFNSGKTFQIPDEAEYLAVAQRLFSEGRIDLLVDGQNIPSRYQPWFSWFFLYPPCRLGLPLEWLNGVVVFFAFLGILGASSFAATVIPQGRKRSAVVVGCGLYIVPAYLYFAGELMTDVPTVALVMFSAALFVLSDRRKVPIRDVAVAGILCAGCVALRPLYVLILVPWIFRILLAPENWVLRSAKALTVSLLSGVVLGASTYLNWRQFGDWMRTGYNLWTAIPYDYPTLVVSLRYLSKNIAALSLDAAFPLVLVGAIFSLPRVEGWNSSISQARRFLVLVLLPIMIFHLVYFYSTIRFFLPLEALLTVLALVQLSAIVSPRVFSIIVASALGLNLTKGVISSSRVSVDSDLHALHANIEKYTAPNSILISGRHPMLVQELLLKGSKRSVLPLSRSTELASKVLVWRKIEVPVEVLLDGESVRATDHRAAWLLSGGASEAYASVAIDDPDRISILLRDGKQVVLITTGATLDDAKRLSEHFVLTPLCDGLMELTLPSHKSV